MINVKKNGSTQGPIVVVNLKPAKPLPIAASSHHGGTRLYYPGPAPAISRRIHRHIAQTM